MDHSAAALDLAFGDHPCQGAIKRFVGQPHSRSEVFEATREHDLSPARIRIENEVMAHAVPSGMDVALFKTGAQRHHLPRQRRRKCVSKLRIMCQLIDKDGPWISRTTESVIATASQ